jgi:hypothetical protein
VPPDIPDHYVDVSQTPDQLAARLRGYPRLRGYRIRRYDDFTHADRYPLAYLAAITAYIGALILLAGLLLSPLVDRRIEAVNLVPDNASPIPGTSYALQVSDIDERGEVSLALLQDGLPLAQGMAAAGRPVSGSGISLYVRDLLPALRVSGLDQNGAPLALQISAEGAPAEEVLLTFTADRPDAFFVAPQAGLAVRVSFTGSAGERVYQVSVFGSPSARLITQMQIRPGDRLESDGQQLVFADESHAIVDIVQAPAQFILAAGMLITLLGLAVVVFYPARQVWLTPIESGTHVAYDKTDLAARRMFEASQATSPEDRT